MNDYLNEVVDHLQKIPEDDRFDLIQYYEEYFLDSGKTLPDQVIDEYGTPKQFALKLKISYFSEEDSRRRVSEESKKTNASDLVNHYRFICFSCPHSTSIGVYIGYWGTIDCFAGAHF